MTHTFARLELSPKAYGEIRSKLDDAGYRHAFHTEADGETIDMHGIGIAIDPRPPVGSIDQEVAPLILYFASAADRSAFVDELIDRPDFAEMIVP